MSKTSYSVYNQKYKQLSKISLLGDVYPPLPDEKYSIIYADPPWDYGGKMQFDKTATIKENEGWNKDIFLSAAKFKYPTLKKETLQLLEVEKLTDKNCLLFMWSTNPHLQQAIEIGTSWGFEYKTVAFVWNKGVHNPGQYTLSYCELCLLFKKGKIPTPRGDRNIKQLISSPRRQHSQKPDEIRTAIEKMFPNQKRIELFARQKFDNWDSWGYVL